MRYSEQTDKLMAALAQFQGTVTAPPKLREVRIRTQNGQEYGYKYAELSGILEHIQPVMKAAGFWWTSSTPIVDGKMVLRTRIGVGTQWMENDYPMPPGGDIKAQGGNITYLRRYNFAMMMGLASQEDADEMPAGNQQGRREDLKNQRQNRQQQQNNSRRNPPEAAAAAQSKDTGPGKGPQDGARISPAPPSGSGGGPGSLTGSFQASPASLRPGQKEREEIVDLCAANQWPAERVPEYLKYAYRVQRLDQLTMVQYEELKKIISGDLLFDEVMEAIKPKPGDFGYTGPGTPEPGSQG
jgi:hypothetical protein